MDRLQLTAERLKAVVHYDELTGVFTRLSVSRASVKSLLGKQAGAVSAQGYVAINVDGVKCRAHRLAWLYMTGNWPVDMVDHINGQKNDNRWVNLRAADMAVNQQNQHRAHADSKTGVLGVFETRNGKFKSQISANGVATYLGTLETKDLAHAAYQSAKATGATA